MLTVAGVVAVAARRRGVGIDAPSIAAAAETHLGVIVGSCFDAAPPTIRAGRGNGVDDAMQRVAAEQGAGGAAQNLDGGGLFGIQLEQIVDVAEAGGANRDAVLQQQKLAAGASAGVYAGANRGEMLVARTPRNPHPGHSCEEFVRMVGAGEIHCVRRQHGGTANGFAAGGDGHGAHQHFLNRGLSFRIGIIASRANRNSGNNGGQRQKG